MQIFVAISKAELNKPFFFFFFHFLHFFLCGMHQTINEHSVGMYSKNEVKEGNKLKM